MKLRYSPPSPFVRKVRIAAALLDLSDRIELVPAQTQNPDDPLRVQNPLGKLPTMLLDDGTTLFDSRVIIEYLDSLASAKTLFPAGASRWEALKLQALADGIAEATLSQIYEARFRPPEKRHPEWVDYQSAKVARALEHLEANVPEQDSAIHVGHVALACALNYIDFRIDSEWRASGPNLANWLDHFAEQVPAYGETAPYQP